MADSKITALTALTAADPVNDMFPAVDVSDTSMAASGTTKRISINNILSSSPTASGALTVTGLVTAGSATITGALTVDTSTLVVNATTDQVGIGTATPASYAGNKLVVYDSTNGQIAIANSTAISNLQSNGVDLYINTNVSGASSNAGSFIIRHGSGFATQLTIDSSNNVNVQSGNVVMATSGKGIDFSANNPDPAGRTSELLNDYEEGTWVPTVGGSSTYTGQAGSYIKVGRLVTVSFDMAILLLNSGSTSTISGLPFVVGSATSPKFEQCNGAAGYFQSLAVNVYSLTFNASANFSTINSISMNTLGGTANVNPAIYGNGTRVQGTVTYMAA